MDIRFRRFATWLSAAFIALSSQCCFAALYEITHIDIGARFFPTAVNDNGVIVGHDGTLGGTSYVYDSNTGNVIDLQEFIPAGDIVALDINNSSHVVGLHNRKANTAFAWNSLSGVSSIGTIGSDNYSVATAINNQGQIVGFSSEANARPDHAFIFENNSIEEIILPFRGIANGINDSGVVVGGSYEPVRSGFVWDSVNGASILTPAFGANAEALGINNSGEVIGWSGHRFGPAYPWQHAVMFDSGVSVDIDIPNNNFSRGTSINDAGMVVGFFRETSESLNGAFLFDGNAFLSLDSLIPSGTGWLLSIAEDINSSGQIVGYGTLNGEANAFLLTPVVEYGGVVSAPGSIFLIMAGTFALRIYGGWKEYSPTIYSSRHSG